MPVEGQRHFGESVAATVGFDFRRGRMDLGVHPCCTGLGPGDCRIAVRFEPRDFSGGLLTILHEVGHGLYEQGLDPRHYGTPIGEAASVGMDESQARLWENHVGRSRGFWQYFHPRARSHQPHHRRQRFPWFLRHRETQSPRHYGYHHPAIERV